MQLIFKSDNTLILTDGNRGEETAWEKVGDEYIVYRSDTEEHEEAAGKIVFEKGKAKLLSSKMDSETSAFYLVFAK